MNEHLKYFVVGVLVNGGILGGLFSLLALVAMWPGVTLSIVIGGIAVGICYLTGKEFYD